MAQSTNRILTLEMGLWVEKQLNGTIKECVKDKQGTLHFCNGSAFCLVLLFCFVQA
jgi:hypothetical protein